MVGGVSQPVPNPPLLHSARWLHLRVDFMELCTSPAREAKSVTEKRMVAITFN